jgi:TRAP-type C4-dicarboxylate transport system permease small subunit
VEAGVSGFLLFVSLAVVTLEIVSRQLFAMPFLWSEELSRYAMIWMAYFGMVAALAEDSHIKVEFLRERMGPALGRWIDALILIGCLCFSLAVVWFGLQWVKDSHMLGMVSADSNIGAPIWVFQTIIPIAYCLMVIRIVMRLLALFRV